MGQTKLHNLPNKGQITISGRSNLALNGDLVHCQVHQFDISHTSNTKLDIT